MDKSVLESRAEEIVREKRPEFRQYSQESLHKSGPYELVLAGLTAGIAMAALSEEQVTQAYLAALDDDTEEPIEVSLTKRINEALAKGEPQNG